MRDHGVFIGTLAPSAIVIALTCASPGCLTDVQVGDGASAGAGEAGDTAGCEEGCGEPCEPECDELLEVCNQGVCACRLGLVACAGACVDPTSDPEHCGGCLQSCGTDVCEQGSCVGACGQSSGTVECGGACVDLDAHPLHCGECDDACEPNELCSGGECLEITGSTCVGDQQCSPDSRCCEAGFFGARLCVEASECP